VDPDGSVEVVRAPKAHARANRHCIAEPVTPPGWARFGPSPSELEKGLFPFPEKLECDPGAALAQQGADCLLDQHRARVDLIEVAVAVIVAVVAVQPVT